tara:strand:- start:5655 stop:6425 length:771 start_codon:yes stop_codon:yes gene_type:complete
VILTELIKIGLSSKSFCKQIECYHKLESTNVKAWEHIDKNEVNHGTLIITDNQVKGKGRGKNKWFSIPGKSLTMSLILSVQIPINKAGLIPLIAGVSVINALDNPIINPLLKWPNDILIGEKKIGGILCESRLDNNNIHSMVIGFGININETINEFPNELKSSSTSLAIEIGNSLQREKVVAVILNIFEKYLEILQTSPRKIIRDWVSFCGHINQKISFKYNGIKYSGIFKGIDNKGQAIVKINENDRIFSSIILD